MKHHHLLSLLFFAAPGFAILFELKWFYLVFLVFSALGGIVARVRYTV